MSLETHFTEIQTILQKSLDFSSGIELAILLPDEGQPISCIRSSASLDETELQKITESVFSTTKRVVKELGKGTTHTITVKAADKFLFIRKIGRSSDDPALKTTLTLLSNTNVHIGIVLDHIEDVAEEIFEIVKSASSSTSTMP